MLLESMKIGLDYEGMKHEMGEIVNIRMMVVDFI